MYICRAMLFDSVYCGGDSCCVCLLHAGCWRVKMSSLKMRKLEKTYNRSTSAKKVVTFVFTVLFESQAARRQHFTAVDWAGTAPPWWRHNAEAKQWRLCRRSVTSLLSVNLIESKFHLMIRWRCPLLRQTICWSSGRGQSDFYSIVVTEFNNNFIVWVERQGTRRNSHSSELRCRWF